MSTTQQIELVQVPVIKHALMEIGAKVTMRLEELNINNLVPTEDTVKALKVLRAELNKEFEDFENKRKEIKKDINKPYTEFDALYKIEIEGKYTNAVNTLKDKIAIVEDKIKLNKKENIVRYFNELCLSVNIDFLKFDHVGLEINLSTSEKQYREKCDAFVNRVQDDILLINTMDFAAEMMAEYKSNSFNASLAIKTVNDRKEAEKLVAERIKQAETNRRQSMLRGLSMAFYDMTKTFNWVQDDAIYITLSDIENLSKGDFQKKFVEIENKINAAKQKAADLFSQSQPAPAETQTTPQVSAPVSKPVAAPIAAPVEVIEPVKEDILSASFEVKGTMAQLMALKAYLIENKLEYKNI